MIFSKMVAPIAALASLSSALPAVKRGGSGGVNIINNLADTVYAWSVSDRVSNMHTLSAGGGNYQESWQSNDNGGGISIKLATSQDQNSVVQFEYTQAGDTIFWDMSLINLSADSEFTKHGFSVIPSDSGCPSVTCAAGDTACAAAYLKPDDDHATHGCPIDTQFTVNIGGQ
ncbi:hypothetical protein BDV23DRAFT_185213 [Aspergillus alliaceus]|uniref:Uncharacterized protein n=2 Tax=Petromyces alliaceus TaxID=209559 RepID=A0A5N7C3D8_PETAA|nr:uncharacterized protein BDW43DRAFT_315965 [Aspergillus alliaceus]KAB8228335.1 hypothetical protein BDW43DRAFT_315965 [Aspergillus alliaceus]KAE8388582.1 hypothetical protein BDV23DRAFT_185213 [Aspergillus alliaceus]